MNLKNFPKRLDSKTSCLRITVPENLDLALEGLIRKVLREQPKTDDIYSFAADYFETLLKIRDKAGAKFTAAQLCPFHNDEDAHEMIKLAGTFTKPVSAKLTRKNDESSKGKKPDKKKEISNVKPRVKKETNKQKPRDGAREKKAGQQKQATPDLIKKLPTVEMKTTKTNDPELDQKMEAEIENEENEEEFLTSDPIKELVEKELMMEATSGKNKTDGNKKTEDGKENTQDENKQLETVWRDPKMEEEKSEIGKREAKTDEKTDEIENRETPKINEVETNTEEEEVKDKTDNLKTQNEEIAEENKNTEAKREKTDTSDKITEGESEANVQTIEDVQKAPEETPKITENTQKDTKEEEKIAESTEVEDKKEETNNKTQTHRESNQKIETFPMVSETIKKVTDVLPTEKLPEITEDVTEKDKEVTQTGIFSIAEQPLEEKSIETTEETSSAEIKPEETETKDTKHDQQPAEVPEEPNNIQTRGETSSIETKLEETEAKDTKHDQKPVKEVLEEANNIQTRTETSSVETKPEEDEAKDTKHDQKPVKEVLEEANNIQTPAEAKPEETETKDTKHDQEPETEILEEKNDIQTPAETSTVEAKLEEDKTKDTRHNQEPTEVHEKAKNTETPSETLSNELKPEETDMKETKEDEQPTEVQQQTDTKETKEDGQLTEVQEEIKTTEISPTEAKPEETETKEDQQSTDNIQPVEEDKVVSTSISENKSTVDSKTIEKVDTENQKSEEEKQVNDISQPTADNDTENNTESEMKKLVIETNDHQNNSEAPMETTTEITTNEAKPEDTKTENEESTTANEPKSEETLTANEDKNFGEIIKNTHEEKTTDRIGSPEAEKPDKETANAKPKSEEIANDNNSLEEVKNNTEQEDTTEVIKPDETTTEAEKTDESVVESTAEPETIKPTGDVREESNQVTENEKPDITTATEPTKDTEEKEAEKKTDKTEPEITLNQDTEHKIEDEKLDMTPQAQIQVETATKEEPKPEKTPAEEQPEELCTVVDIEQIPKEDKITTEKEPEPEVETVKTVDDITTEKTEGGLEPEVETVKTVEDRTEVELNQTTEDQTDPEELCTVVDIEHIPKSDKIDENVSQVQGENIQKDDKAETEELCTVVDIQNLPKEDRTNTTQRTESPKTSEIEQLPEEHIPNESEHKPENTEHEGNKTEATETTEKPTTDTEHIITVDEVENSTKTDEIQIKTIQTHYYDTLQVPETVTKEYRVHNLPQTANTLLGVANFLSPNTEGLLLDENMNSPPTAEKITFSPPGEEKPEETKKTDLHLLPLNQNDVEAETQKTDSDDFLDLMTPTSGYSLNLSEISLLTASELFLDSEKRYSSLEKEEIRYVTPKTEERTDSRQEVEEVIEKTVLPSGIEAVPVPPREVDEINEEANLQIAETVKEKKNEEKEPKKEEKPENNSSDGSSNGVSVDSDIPFISVEVKTVIETQVLDDEDEDKNGGHPEIEVNVQTTIDIQDDLEMLEPKPETVAAGETEMSNGKAQEKTNLNPSLEGIVRKSQDEDRKESCSTTGMEGSSLESDLTTSSAATEIKRSDSAKRNLSSARSLVSTQSLDLGMRNPLIRTRSLSTFRHGVTDFEVWNTIEKELEDAAIKIQSKFRGYKTRKKLQRENAVQITTEESSVSTTPVETEAKDEGQQSTGEFHDSIILSDHPR